MLKKNTNKHVKQVLYLYKKGMSSAKIGKKLKISPTTVTKILNIYGVKLRSKQQSANMKYNKKIKKIIRLYNKGTAGTKISKLVDLSETTIYKILKNNNIHVKTNSESKRKYKLYENFFDKIDSEEKAYFLGFLFADGYNNKNRNFIVLKLKRDDKKILKILNNLIYENRPLLYTTSKTNDKTHKMCSLQISSAHMSSVLNNIGCIQRKTSILRFPKINDKLVKHFIRGYFDGDGGISTSKNKLRKSISYSLSITSTKPFLTNIKKYIESKIDVKFHFEKKSYSKDGKVFKLKLNGNRQILKFIKYIYNNSAIHMERKRKFINLIETQNYKITSRKCKIYGCKRKTRTVNLCWKHLIQEKRKTNPNFFIKSNLDIDKAIKMYKAGQTQISIANYFNVSCASICNHFKRLGVT